MEIKDRPGLDDPIWEYVVRERCAPYIPFAKQWWEAVEDKDFIDTGVYMLNNTLPGLSVRFTRTALRSPIKGVQAFPFVFTGYLQISGVQGGANKMIERVCARGIDIDGIALVEKHNLPSTFLQGQFIAFVPVPILHGAQGLGKWVYFAKDELTELASGVVSDKVKARIMLKL